MNFLCRYFFILPLFLLLVACNKTTDNGIPYYQVNLTIHTTDPSFVNLSVVGGWEYISGGSKGILLYRSSNDEFKAYDRHCTFQPSDACSRVAVDSTQIAAVDSCCGSSFLIIDGSILNGPAVSPLKQYQTSFDGSVLRITN